MSRSKCGAQVVYDLDLKWWTLEGAYAGYVHDKGLVMTGEIGTKQGVLRTTLTQMRKHYFNKRVLQVRRPGLRADLSAIPL